MKHRVFIYIFHLFIATLLASACQKQGGNSSQESNVDKAMTLIEQNRNDEAINLLLKEIDSTPSSDQARQVLASAYANRAGVRVESYYGFAVTYDSLIKGAQDFQIQNSNTDIDLSQIFPGISATAKSALQQFSANLYILQRIHNRVAQIPLVNEKQSEDLIKAIQVLQPTLPRGARVYRAILEIIVLRSFLQQSTNLIQSASSGNNCPANFDTALQSIEFSFQLLQQILIDLSKAFPSNSDNLMQTENQLNTVLNSLPDSAKKTRLQLCQGP